MQEHLSPEIFFHQLSAHKGLIPVELNTDLGSIKWMDMEKYHFYEGFFHKSIRIFSALKSATPVTFTTSADILKDRKVVTDYIYPTGFIFHAGRSGSTLLSKVLSRSAKNLVLSEAQPLNAVWKIFTNDGEQPLELTDTHINVYRNLVLAMARKRLPSHKHLFIKFTSFNIRFFRFIHAAFPDVPAVFLTRNIDEIIASWQNNLPGWLQAGNTKVLKMLTGSDIPDLEKIVEGFLTEGRSYPAEMLTLINYNLLNPENLQSVLNCFNLHPDEATLQFMKTEFQFDSKHELKRR